MSAPAPRGTDEIDAQIAELVARRDAIVAEAEHPRKKGVLHYLGVGVSVGLLAFVVLIAVLVVVVPMVTGSRPLTVLTGSMEPAYPPGTLVIVKPTPVEDIRLGDVDDLPTRVGQVGARDPPGGGEGVQHPRRTHLHHEG